MKGGYPLILVPAYGRSYKTEEACLKDWNDNKDFVIEGGPYCSIRDLESMKEDWSVISIRYKKGLYLKLT